MPIDRDGNYDTSKYINFKKDRDVFVQFKGSYLCADVSCPNCGSQEHIDSEFAYVWVCDECKKSYALEPYINLIEVKAGE